MKKLNKKLVINKETIANLNNEQQFQVLGGGISLPNDCVSKQPSCPTEESCQKTCGEVSCCCSLPGNYSCQVKVTKNTCPPTV